MWNVSCCEQWKNVILFIFKHCLIFYSEVILSAFNSRWHISLFLIFSLFKELNGTRFYFCVTHFLCFLFLLPQCSVLAMALKQKACHLHAPHLPQSWPFMHGTGSSLPKPEVCRGLPLVGLTLWLPHEGRDGISCQLLWKVVANVCFFHGNYFGSGSFAGTLKEPKVVCNSGQLSFQKIPAGTFVFLRWKMKLVRPRHAMIYLVEVS